MREPWGQPLPSPVALGQGTEKFREAVKALAEQYPIPVYPFDHKERKDDGANQIRQPRGEQDGILFDRRDTGGKGASVPRQEGGRAVSVHAP